MRLKGSKRFQRYENVGSYRWILLDHKLLAKNLETPYIVRNNIDPLTGDTVEYTLGGST